MFTVPWRRGFSSAVFSEEDGYRVNAWPYKPGLGDYGPPKVAFYNEPATKGAVTKTAIPPPQTVAAGREPILLQSSSILAAVPRP